MLAALIGNDPSEVMQSIDVDLVIRGDRSTAEIDR